jgi:ankyrin repeat protein
MTLLLKHGADPKFVFNVEYIPDATTSAATWVPRRNITTALMAAVGMGGGAEWVPLDRAKKDALILEAVRIAADAGTDLNVLNTDGRSALDAARALKNDPVIKYLESKGAMPGNAPQRGGARGRGGR